MDRRDRLIDLIGNWLVERGTKGAHVGILADRILAEMDAPAAPVDSATPAGVLSCEVRARVDTRTLTALTNLNDPSADAPDDVALEGTCADAIDRFELLTGVAYDAVQSWHVGAGIDLTLSLLHLRAGNLDAAKAHRDAAKPMLRHARAAAARGE